jgi:predicted secreted hydrolase
MNPVLPRRGLVKSGLAGVWAVLGVPSAVLSGVTANSPITLPRDSGAHPDFQTEWWYITGYANTVHGDAALGFQITFFRSRVPQTQNMRSTLAAKQLIFAHAAVTDVKGQKLWHDQRIARWSGTPPGTNAADSATANIQAMNIRLGNWFLDTVAGTLRAGVKAGDFSLDLRFTQTQDVLLQGDRGLSRKGPDPAQLSHYYSLPQLRAEGEIALRGQRYLLTKGSTAWLDHEWSQSLLHPQAVGWDWIGINLFDGSALTAFQLRNKAGQALWDGGSYRSGSHLLTFAKGDVLFKPVRSWRSPQSQCEYPVEWTVRTPTDTYTVKAVVDNQELDSRASTGSIYWEGLSEVLDFNHRMVGRGYLEMTGYAAPLKL